MILLLLMAGLSAGASAQDRDSLLVVFWNLENFFDYRSDNKPQYWTKARFYAKCDGVAKTLLRIADRYGRLPDAVGFAEVENARVLRRLLDATALRKLDYRIVHYDSPDPRGIDCALLCRRSTLPLRASAAAHVPDSTGVPLLTRDILVAQFDSLAVLVNHHPSQLGGKAGRSASISAQHSSTTAAGRRSTGISPKASPPCARRSSPTRRCCSPMPLSAAPSRAAPSSVRATRAASATTCLLSLL